MCGIAGMLLAPNKDVQQSQLEAMGTRLQHRGPDNFGCVIQENYGAAHTRLSILDLSAAGNQPFANERYTLIYNGEIYNYLDLQAPLLEQGVTLKSTSDTEVLFHHLILFGVDATLPKLRGMFAFSFFDSHEETLYVCRDKLGIKPVVYTCQDGDFYWASEVKALAKVANIQVDAIRLLFSASVMFDGRNQHTVFHGVKNVPKGGYLVVKPGQAPRIEQYYDLADDIDETYYRELDALTMAEAVERFRKLMDDSIRGMLLSDAPMGVFASGGVDSSLIAAIAYSQTSDLSLFTANVVGQYSEIEDARLLSREIGTPLHEAEYGKDFLLRRWARATWFYEAPIIQHLNALPLGDVAELARERGVKAVLTGEGSDELFLGYPFYVARRYKKLKTPIELMQKAYGIIPSVRRYLFPRETGNMHLFFPKLMSDFEEETAQERYEAAYSFVPDEQRKDLLSSTKLIQGHLVSLLHRNDRMGMMAGIESRFPFLDDEILRFALNLPVKFKIQPVRQVHNRKHPFLKDKAIVRHLCEGQVPDSILHKKKFGFPTYGHQSLVLQPGFFDGGYIEEKLELTSKAKQQLLSDEYRFFAARMASVEIFGRLFEYGETSEDITDHLLACGEINPDIQSKHAVE